MNRIECCYMNRLNGSDELFREFENKQDVTVETFNCIGNCSICVEKFHCIANGIRCVGETNDTLKNEIAKVLKK